MLVDVQDSDEEEVPVLVPVEQDEEVPALVESSRTNNLLDDNIPDIPVTIITG